jgi:hypothetical protein
VCVSKFVFRLVLCSATAGLLAMGCSDGNVNTSLTFTPGGLDLSLGQNAKSPKGDAVGSEDITTPDGITAGDGVVTPDTGSDATAMPDSKTNDTSGPEDAVFDGDGALSDLGDGTKSDTEEDAAPDAMALDPDEDGIPTADDNCPKVSNADQANHDNDDKGDACDDDDDNDGINDVNDNCPMDTNADQANTDNDDEGNACDDDDDNDGINDEDDNCPEVSNPDQASNDSDGQGNACDDDDDSDGINDEDDNCPQKANADQANNDEDAEGDVCDDDDDNDGIIDVDDNCPELSNPEQTNTDNDENGNACDDDDDGDGDPDDSDCGPENATIYNGAFELCDGDDNNCNGETDEGEVCLDCLEVALQVVGKFEFCDHPRSWPKAKEICENRGAQLTYIKGPLEQAALVAVIPGIFNTHVWIGLNDLDKEDQFVWADGSLPSFEAWYGSEPNNWQNNEDCTEMRKDFGYLWNDRNCNNELRFICRYKP